MWKGEAFRLWVDLWASLYDDESRSAELLHEVHDTYYLVAVVDNNFVDGNLWDVRGSSLELLTVLLLRVQSVSWFDAVFLLGCWCFFCAEIFPDDRRPSTAAAKHPREVLFVA